MIVCNQTRTRISTGMPIHAGRGGHTHAIAGRGYYMLFILNTAGAPSKAKFIRLR